MVYDYDTNTIHGQAFSVRLTTHIIEAYEKILHTLTSNGISPKLLTMDNEISTALKDFITASSLDVQLVPPHLHRRNSAERAIRTFKSHFISILCGTDPSFPINLWDKLLPQAILTLNLLRTSRINLKLSAYSQVWGPFDYNRTPLAPLGTKLLIHEKPSSRESWSPHAVPGWYIGPALDHYRCFRTWVTETNAERIADTVVWYPQGYYMPKATSLDTAAAAAYDLVQALLRPRPPTLSPLCPESMHDSLLRLATIFKDSILHEHKSATNFTPITTNF